MTVTLTFEAATPTELWEQVRQYAEQTRPSERDEPVAPRTAGLTNEDYRRAILAIQRGKVASYSVVSEVVRGDADGSQKVAGLAANDQTLGTAYRVIKKDRSIAAGFRWPDGRMGGSGDGRRILEDEGVGFDKDGHVLPEFVLSVDELRALYEPADRWSGSR
ncbi:MAG TPA: hypothetical protein VGG08_05300 [Solirubrobacteraceae bacterium]|jgi:alkylated DNA nucleotide flippase Atl1